MYAIQLTHAFGISWWCENGMHKTGFGAEKFRELYATEADAQRKLNYCQIWAWRYNRNTAIKVNVKEIGYVL